MRTDPPNVVLYEGTYIDLLCALVVNESAIANTTFTWTDPDNEEIDGGDGDYTITDQFNTSTLRIESLTVFRDNMAVYTCIVTADPNPGFERNTSLELSSSVTLTVNGNVK